MKIVKYLTICALMIFALLSESCKDDDTTPSTVCNDLTVCFIGTWNATANFLAGDGPVTFNDDMTGSSTAGIFVAVINDEEVQDFTWEVNEIDKSFTITYNLEGVGGFSISLGISESTVNKITLVSLIPDDDSVITLTR